MKFSAVLAVALLAALPAGAASLDGTHVHGLAWDPADPGRLLVATHHGLLALEDGELAAVSERRDDFMGFSVHPAGGGVFLASGHPEGGGNLGVIVSRDGGRTWEPLSPGADGPVDFHQMDVGKADPAIMVGVFGAIQASRNGGRTWAVTGRPPAPMIGLALSAIDSEKIYAATQAGLFESPDLGASWSKAGDTEAPVTMVTTTADGTVWAYDVQNGLTRKVPGANEFAAVGPTLADDAILHLAVKDGEMAAATYNGAMIRSTDGGRTWIPLLQ
ncbi:WD40/YVTN/BNR-like repeat-containing protein [Chthonobacter albigriseus]|uniref:WD40/YVTN/BNR-like repeat-containing protein n=1 Tax=Chthonobacter albigriseus TaxID=1683161 RepID=UPI0015EEDB87|nr:exo-alpha-sialidase [Chthonobacter albigriseus]